MKSTNPYRLLLIGSLVVLAGYSLIYFAISYFVHSTINWTVYTISALILFSFTYFTFSFIIRRFIYDKIKLIYKNILTLKVPKQSKDRSINLHEDVINRVNEDVANWAEQRKQEIEELKRMESYRREFLGNVSHELKTPIFNIQGYIHTLLDGALEDPEVNRDYLEKSAHNIERMINIVQDLGIISQLESGEIHLEFSRFDIVALAREIYEMLEIKALKKDIRLVFHDEVDSDTHIHVYADKERIRQVMINLIENSIKYGNEGGRTKVSFYDMDEIILVEISDNGIGIEEKHLPRLFERFYRVDKSRSRNQGGSGLGLAIVKHIIESHKQTVNVRSATGVGSTFSFTVKKG